MNASQITPSPRRVSALIGLAALAGLALALFTAPAAVADPAPDVASTVAPAAVYADMPDFTGDEARLEGEIRRVLDRTLARNIFDWVYATVDGETVQLHGWVYYGADAQRIAKGIARIDGVDQVVNRVQLLSVSGFDENLRRDAARAIYRHPLFNQYPRLGSLPVHVVVQDGRITLEGTVNTRAEAYAAELAARSGVTSFGVHSNLRVASELTP